MEIKYKAKTWKQLQQNEDKISGKTIFSSYKMNESRRN